ncbi:MAG TPA: DUF4350 domain-containing protein [Pyrinomonadaceae bacterium]
MRKRLGIFITVGIVAVLLIALNTASYVNVEKEPDTELNPDRSTYNAGATGTRALYELLDATGRKVTRWREKADALLSETEAGPTTLVVVGKMKLPFDGGEPDVLLDWVARGHRLVIIDRRPDPRLLPQSDRWIVSTTWNDLPGTKVDPSKSEEMTAGVASVSPDLPSVLTRDVKQVKPSRFAGTINVSRASDDEPSAPDAPAPPVPSNAALSSSAPVTHLESDKGALLVDYPHGAGRIIILSDPYIVSNGGILLEDNMQLAINMVAGGGGLIAFDEYHQGHGASSNQLVAYFAGTPVLWIVAQGLLIVLVLLWTRGRRFARPLPVKTVDRRSSLEFVASMAELQQRARAFDLAIENIYTRLRRVLVRYSGLSHNSRRSQIAARVAARSEKINAAELETLMRECEDAINGTPVDAGRALSLVRQLREVERTLGLRMRSRETRQAAEGLQQDTV